MAKKTATKATTKKPVTKKQPRRNRQPKQGQQHGKQKPSYPDSLLPTPNSRLPTIKRPDSNLPPSAEHINEITDAVLDLVGQLDGYAANLRALDRRRRGSGYLLLRIQEVMRHMD